MSLDRIAIKGLTVTGHHGVLESERVDGQPFVVDLQLWTDTSRAAQTDDLVDTVDYGAVAQRVADVVAGDPVDLIETLAQRIADVVLLQPLVERVEVTIRKPQAPIPLTFEHVGVTILRGRP